MTTSSMQIPAELIARFTARYGDFASAAYQTDERMYKLAAAERLHEQIGRAQLGGMIARGAWDEARSAIMRATGGSFVVDEGGTRQTNNLLNQYDTRPLREAPAEDIARRLYDLLYGDGPFDARFDAWVQVLSTVSERCWPAATYFLMLHDPQRHIFVKAEPFRAMLDAVGGPQWNPRPTAALYDDLRHVAAALLDNLRPLGARDMIDVQSFVWVVQERPQAEAAHSESKGHSAMARIADPQLQPFYAAAERFVNAALRHDDSLFTPGVPIWSLENLNRLHHDYVEQPDTSSGTFLDKLHDQLAHSDPATIQLMGEVLYVHLLPANGIRPDTKRKQVNTVLQWSSEPVRMPAELEKGLDHGVAKASQAYLNLKWVQLAFLITFARAWKQLPQDERERALADPWEFKRIVWNIPMQTAYAQREILLYLVFPDSFLPTFSREHKALLTKHFNDLADPAEEDIDRRILAIRRKLEPQYGDGFTFYQPELKPLWLDGKPPLPPSGPLPHTLGPRLRPYVELITHLSGSSYTPEQIVEPLGRVSPRIAPDLTSAPDAHALVRDLMHMRLLKVTEPGFYRRWPHLDDATVDHIMRYAALTLLVPQPGGGYDMPGIRAPFDGQPHPASAWPYGEALLQWYEEAGLVEQNDDGAWQSLPGALEPLNAATSSAQALNTFLQYLHQVREQQGDLPPVADAPLPLLDPDTLDERIAEIQRVLLVDRATILRIYRALIAGQHVILSGPPGTGKTHLATLLPRVLWQDIDTGRVLSMPTDPALPPTAPPIERVISRSGYTADVVTATEDWGVRQVIGGIAPQLLSDGERPVLVYRVRHGCLTRAVLSNYHGYDGEDVPPVAALARQEISDGAERYRGRWLVIDEFTRAPIDAAFGSLLTTLGGQRSPLMVPTDAGDEVPVPLPQDFRIIGTLNSFDRHFLNQISEAMKRRFTFIDVLPPGRDQRAQEQAMAAQRALRGLHANGMPDIAPAADGIVWEDVLRVTRDGAGALQIEYLADADGPDAPETLGSLWRMFAAIRVYRQLGTAQLESVCSALFSGRMIGMDWPAALDSALADVLADQLQVLARDEVRVLLAYLDHAADAERFATAVRDVLKSLPPARQMAHLAQLRAADTTAGGDPIDDLDANALHAAQLQRVFELGAPMIMDASGLFARRLRAFVHERGL